MRLTKWVIVIHIKHKDAMTAITQVITNAGHRYITNNVVRWQSPAVGSRADVSTIMNPKTCMIKMLFCLITCHHFCCRLL